MGGKERGYVRVPSAWGNAYRGDKSPIATSGTSRGFGLAKKIFGRGAIKKNKRKDK